MNIGPYIAYVLYIYISLSFIKKGGFVGPKFHHHEILAVFGHFGHHNG